MGRTKAQIAASGAGKRKKKTSKEKDTLFTSESVPESEADKARGSDNSDNDSKDKQSSPPTWKEDGSPARPATVTFASPDGDAGQGGTQEGGGATATAAVKCRGQSRIHKSDR